MILAGLVGDVLTWVAVVWWACYIGFWIGDLRERVAQRDADRRRYLRLVEKSVEQGHPVPTMPSELADRRSFFRDIVFGPLAVAVAAGVIVYALTEGG